MPAAKNKDLPSFDEVVLAVAMGTFGFSPFEIETLAERVKERVERWLRLSPSKRQSLRDTDVKHVLEMLERRGKAKRLVGCSKWWQLICDSICLNCGKPGVLLEKVQIVWHGKGNSCDLRELRSKIISL